MEDTLHGQIMEKLGEIKETGEGIKKRLDILNGSVAKHADKLANQDVLNAQMTITQQQIVKDLEKSGSNEKINNEFILRTQGSINTFKWLFGFVGIGSLLTLIKVLSL